MRYTLLLNTTDEARPMWLPKFTFDAVNQVEANHKAAGWGNYQGYSHRDVKARPAQGEERTWQPHNEYVERF